jgi:hypothetical protein
MIIYNIYKLIGPELGERLECVETTSLEKNCLETGEGSSSKVTLYTYKPHILRKIPKLSIINI